MPITELLERNAAKYPSDVSLVEINPKIKENRRVTWKEYEKANRFANYLMSMGIKRGHKVGIIMMNCLEWLPIYFGVLKTGAMVVPFNFRYSSDEIMYCAKLSQIDILVFGPEFIGRMWETTVPPLRRITKKRLQTARA